MVAQILAEVLGIGLGRIRVIAADTDLTPIHIGSYSSRVTFMNGNASLRSAEDVKKKIVAAAALKMNCAPEDVMMRDDRVWKRGTASPGTNGAGAELATKAYLRRQRTRGLRPRGRTDAAGFVAAEAQRRRPERPDEF